MKRKILFIAIFLAICGAMSSCSIKANKDDLVLVVQDVIGTENGKSAITFRNSDVIIHSAFKPSISAGEVLLVKPSGQYVVLSENNHLDFVIILMLILFAFFIGCLVTGRYVRRCLEDNNPPMGF